MERYLEKSTIMAKYKGEEKSGKVGKMIYSSWHGRPYMRRMPESVANPQTEAQQAHRNAFAAISRLSSDMKEAHLVGFHKQALRDHLNTHSVFKKFNKGCFIDDSICYAKVVVSYGSVPMAHITSVEVDERRMMRLTFDGNTSEQTENDEFCLFVYCPDLRDCRPALPVLRSAGIVTAQLPEEWTGHDLHLYAFLRNKKGITSHTMYTKITDAADIE